MSTSPVMLITGCSTGLGYALAIEAAQQGFRVFATARKAADVTALQQQGLHALQLDIADPESVQAAVATLTQQAGRLDVLVNNAGYGAMGPVLDASPEQIRQQFDTNVFGLVALCQACLPLLEVSQGLIVNIGSVSARLTTPFAGWYCASKAALHSLSDAMRMELAPLGVRLMLVQAGAMASAFATNASAQATSGLSEASRWWPYRLGIQRRAHASQQRPTPVTKVAADLMHYIGRQHTPAVLRLAHGAWLFPVLAWLPKSWSDRLLARQFGLTS